MQINEKALEAAIVAVESMGCVHFGAEIEAAIRAYLTSATPPDVADQIDDLIEQLLDAQQDINLAANERMDQSLCDASALIDKTETILRQAAERLAGARVKVKALDWVDGTAACLYGAYTIHRRADTMWEVTGYSTFIGGPYADAEAAKAAAQADYERRILSALDTHQRSTNTVVSHETANVSDKPEGQQEPVARGVVWFGYDENTGEFTGEYCSVKPHDARGMRPYIPYTTPTDASAIREALERGHALANQVRAVTCHLNGQAYSSTVSALNYFDAALSRAALAGAKP